MFLESWLVYDGGPPTNGGPGSGNYPRDKKKSKTTKSKIIKPTKDNKDFLEKHFLKYGKKEFGQILKKLRDVPIKKLSKPKSDDEIIKDIGGKDIAEGSCQSLAIAYLANLAGYDIKDHRLEEGTDNPFSTRDFFGSDSMIEFLANDLGAKVYYNENVKNEIDEIHKNILPKMEENKPYVLAAPVHTSLVKKVGNDFYFLELQDGNNRWNGWRKIPTYGKMGTNKNIDFWFDRFEAINRRRNPKTYTLLDGEKLIKNKDFRKILGFINTKDYGEK